ncbi:MAG: mechanosensitive ion channel family protein, partial [Pseudobdellovibrionaceae bacterium]
YLARKTSSIFFNRLFDTGLEKKIAWLFTVLIWIAFVDAAQFPEKVNQYLKLILQVILIFNVFRFIYFVIESFSEVLRVRAEKTESTLDDQLVPFASKGLKALVILLGGLLTLQSFGVNVNSVLAGLGIGGMAIAFAAQESIAAFFGSLVILTDAPFKLGDLIKFGDHEGTVEHIGFRSTRIRALNDTLLIIPNSTMAKENINNLTERKRRRISQTLGILYETDVKKIEEFMDQLRYFLMQHKMIDSKDITVTFSGFGDFSLSIKIVFFVLSSALTEEAKIQTEVYLEFMRIAQSLNVGFAYPTQTLYHVQNSPR